MRYKNDPNDSASYIILKEKTNNMGFDIEEVLVKYDREKMTSSILLSNMPNNENIKKFTRL